MTTLFGGLFGGGSAVDLYDGGNVSGALEIDGSDGDVQKFTLTGNVTGISVVNLDEGESLTVFFDNSGGYSIDYSALLVDNLTGVLDNLDSFDYPRLVIQKTAADVVATNAGAWDS